MLKLGIDVLKLGIFVLIVLILYAIPAFIDSL